MKVPNWVWLAGLAGAGYALYRLSDNVKNAVNYVTAPFSNAIADSIIANDPFLSQPTVQSTLTGSVLFPNGARVPMTSLAPTAYNGPNGFEARVVYQGATYRLSAHDANGNYPATRV